MNIKKMSKNRKMMCCHCLNNHHKSFRIFYLSVMQSIHRLQNSSDYNTKVVKLDNGNRMITYFELVHINNPFVIAVQRTG